MSAKFLSLVSRVVLVVVLILGGVVSLSGVVPSFADDSYKSRIPPLSLYQKMLEANKSSGWVSFRNYGNHQLIYFTALQTLHCQLHEIRYSINTLELNKRFKLVKCNPQLPFSLPPGGGLEDIALRLPKGTAERIAVQVVWGNGTLSEVSIFEPCKNVGDQTCSFPVKVGKVVGSQPQRGTTQ
jgi:hypothetical protein